VLLNPTELAETIARIAGEQLSARTLRELAWALANGQGIARQGETTVYAVLGDPLADDSVLTVIKARLSTSGKGRRLRAGPQVMDAFRAEHEGVNLGPKPSPALWFPVLQGVAARIMVGGRLPIPKRRKFGDREVYWYLLDLIPVGDLFYYFRLNDNTLAVYQRIDTILFARLTVQAPSNLVRMSHAIEQVAQGQEVEGIAPMEGTPRLMRTRY
jgi:hypothetical protein